MKSNIRFNLQAFSRGGKLTENKKKLSPTTLYYFQGVVSIVGNCITKRLNKTKIPRLTTEAGPRLRDFPYPGWVLLTNLGYLQEINKKFAI